MVLNYYARNYSESLAPACINTLQRYNFFLKQPNILSTFFIKTIKKKIKRGGTMKCHLSIMISVRNQRMDYLHMMPRLEFSRKRMMFWISGLSGTCS